MAKKKLTLLHSNDIHGDFLPKTADGIDEEVKTIIDQCYARAKKIILEHKDVLDASAALLLEKEKISREEFEALFEQQGV